MYEIVGSGVGCRVGTGVDGLGDGEGLGDSEGVGANVDVGIGNGVGDGGTTLTVGVAAHNATPRRRAARGTRTIAACCVVRRRMVLG